MILTKDIDRVIDELQKTYFNDKIPRTARQAYYSLCHHPEITIEKVDAALPGIYMRIPFFPKPSEIADAVLGKPENRARRLFSLILKAVQTASEADSVEWGDHRLFKAVEECGGWIAVRSGYLSHMEFIDRYTLTEALTAYLDYFLPGPTYSKGRLETMSDENYRTYSVATGMFIEKEKKTAEIISLSQKKKI